MRLYRCREAALSLGTLDWLVSRRKTDEGYTLLVIASCGIVAFTIATISAMIR